MDYGEILSRAAKIIWKFKVLWIFGLFASCTRGGGGGGGGGNGGMNNGDFNNPNFPFNFELPQIPDNVGILLIIAGILLVLLFIIVSLILGTYGRIGLIKGTWVADEGAASLRFGELWRSSSPYFWRVLGLEIILFFLTLLLIAMLVLPLLAVIVPVAASGSNDAWAPIAGVTIVVLCLMCLLVPVIWAISILIELTFISMIGENLGIGAAFSRAWGIVREKPGPVLLMAVIVTGLRILLGIVIGILFAIVGLPALGLGVLIARESWQTALAGGILIALILIPLSLLINAILESYFGAVWTLTFRRLTGRLAAAETLSPSEPLPPAPPVETV